MTLTELAEEIEAIIGSELEDVKGSINRVVVKKPAPERGFEAFTVTFKSKTYSGLYRCGCNDE